VRWAISAISEVPLDIRGLEPFDADSLHAQGLVFEPVGSFEEARRTAAQDFEKRVRSKSKLDRISQVFVRIFRRRSGMVYYPLWILRYLYRGRAFQVVVDGISGSVLYGKAPGNTYYRAAVLVGGMALGAFLALDVTLFALYLFSEDSDLGAFAIAAFLGGLALMFWAYRRFRHGEEFEFQEARKAVSALDLRESTQPEGAPEMGRPVELVPLQCLRCSTPIPAQPDEAAWVCQSCGQGQLLDERQGLLTLDVHCSTAVPPGGRGRPFWIVMGPGGAEPGYLQGETLPVRRISTGRSRAASASPPITVPALRPGRPDHPRRGGGHDRLGQDRAVHRPARRGRPERHAGPDDRPEGRPDQPALLHFPELRPPTLSPGSMPTRPGGRA
jgi:hypothetical protein